MNKVQLNFITKDKVHYFRFLLDKGFRISRASKLLESFGDWFVEFESPDCFIVVLSDRDEVFVRIYPVKADRKIVLDLGFMIYYLSHDRNFVGKYDGNLVGKTRKQLRKMSELLEEYIDQIISCLVSEFTNHKLDIMLAEKEYKELQIVNYRQRTK